MSGGGDQKSKQKSTTKLPEWYETGAKNAINFGQEAAQGGYIPYIGPDVAALSPASKAAFGGIDAMSAAFGMPTGASSSYLPEEVTGAGGVKGYSSFPGFEESMNALKAKFPGAYDFISKYSKLGQGSSINPSQVTPGQSMLAPGFNATMNLFNGSGAPGGGAGPAAPGGAPGASRKPGDILRSMGKSGNKGVANIEELFNAMGGH